MQRTRHENLPNCSGELAMSDLVTKAYQTKTTRNNARKSTHNF